VKIFKIMALMALMGITGSVALADSGAPPDPNIAVNKIKDPLCNADGSTPAGVDYTCFTTNSQQDPLTVPGGQTVNYVLASGSLSTLYVEVTPTQLGESYLCVPGDVFAACTNGIAGTVAGGVEVEFFNGTLLADTEVGVSAPEPKGILLLMAGLLPLFAFRKRIASSLSL
jgi:hypothetical protein